MKKEQMVGTRLPDTVVRDLEAIEEVEQSDRSTTVRKRLDGLELFLILAIVLLSRCLVSPFTGASGSGDCKELALGPNREH
jgi:hypothetical protein